MNNPTMPILQSADIPGPFSKQAAEIGRGGRLACQPWKSYQACSSQRRFQKSLGELKSSPPARWRRGVCDTAHVWCFRICRNRKVDLTAYL